MLPNINLFGKTITWYTIAVLTGIFIVLIFQQIYTKKIGHDEVFMLYILLFGSIGAFAGGHILYAITMYKQLISFISNPENFSNFKTIINNLASIFGGSVFYGGLLGGIFSAYLYMRKKKFDLDPYIGIGALCIPLFHGFGRIGCFLSGCCYGIESTFGIDLKYSPVPGCSGVLRFPVQLIESGCNFIIFFLLLFLFNKKIISGRKTLISYLMLYSIIRFVLEFFRGDWYRGFIGPLSTSQIISIAVFVVCLIALLFNIQKKKNKSISVEN